MIGTAKAIHRALRENSPGSSNSNAAVNKIEAANDQIVTLASRGARQLKNVSNAVTITPMPILTIKLSPASLLTTHQP